MSRTLAVAWRVLLQIRGDRRTLALLLVAPMAVLTLLWLLFGSEPYKPKLAAVDLPEPVVAALRSSGARVEILDGAAAEAKLRRRELDAVISLQDDGPHIRLEGSDPGKTAAVRSTMIEAVRVAVIERVRKVLPAEPPQPVIEFLHGGRDMKTFDYFGPVLLGFLVFFFTFIVSGISFVRERQTGTLERMLSTAVRRHEVVLGYLLGFAVVVALQSTLMTVYGLYVLGIMLKGSVFWLLLVVLLLAATALCLGMFLSAYARTEFQMLQFIPLVIVPQIFFSGLFPTDSMPLALVVLGRAFPLSYGADAMREIMIRGGGLGGIWVELAALAAFSLVLAFGNVRALKRYRPL